MLESARERDVLLRRTAPHLVRPLPMVVPLSRDLPPREGVLFDVGHRLGDGFRLAAGTPRRALPRPRRLGVTETVRLLPGVRREGLRGALLNWDGQLEDDARLVVGLARTAASYGARVVTRARVAGRRRRRAPRVRDELTGATAAGRRARGRQRHRRLGRRARARGRAAAQQGRARRPARGRPRLARPRR